MLRVGNGSDASFAFQRCIENPGESTHTRATARPTFRQYRGYDMFVTNVGTLISPGIATMETMTTTAFMMQESTIPGCSRCSASLEDDTDKYEVYR